MINEEEWKAHFFQVQEAMLKMYQPCIATISKTSDGLEASAAGSGLYFNVANKPFLLTCEHVRTQALTEKRQLAHLPKGGDSYHQLNNEWVTGVWPVDLAVTLISDDSWKVRDREALITECIAETHDPETHELFFVAGHPGQNSLYIPATKELITPRTNYMTQQTKLPCHHNPDTHFAIHYEMGLAQSADGREGKLPKPPGFSGAPIWDTGFVRGGCSSEWQAGEAKLTGIAQIWDPKNSLIIAIKAEAMNRFLSNALENFFTI